MSKQFKPQENKEKKKKDVTRHSDFLIKMGTRIRNPGSRERESKTSHIRAEAVADTPTCADGGCCLGVRLDLGLAVPALGLHC